MGFFCRDVEGSLPDVLRAIFERESPPINTSSPNSTIIGLLILGKVIMYAADRDLGIFSTSHCVVR